MAHRVSKGWVAALIAAAATNVAGCGRGSDGELPSGQAPPLVLARERIAHMPAVRAQAMRQLVAAPGAQPAPTSPLAFAPEVSVDARILIITANSTDPAFAAIQGTLAFLGTPYDVLDAASGPPLTDASLADGDHGKYQAVFLDLGDLSLGTASAFSDAEWMTLATYEARFGVRRVSLYTAPSAAYGLSATGAMIDATSAPVTASCTTAGAATFVGANCAAPVVIAAGWAYPARPTDAQTIPLLVDAAGNLYAATRTYPDGREALALTFAQSPDAMHTLELAYGLVSWATRGLFVGERHVYLSAQLDDFFLASTIYRGSAPTYRITGADLQALADWQTSRRANPLVAGLRLAWAANAEGSVTAGDALTAKAVALGPAFSWISHTWDHAELTLMGYADALLEFQRNDARIRALGLTPYATANLVTPGITGLDNPNAMQAAFDAGIRYLVSDTSIPSQDNPSPNAGFYNALVPGILEIPRIPTELDYDVSMPAEWMAEYNDIYGTSWGYDQLLAIQSRTLVGYMLAGNNDPWMFHQANTRDIGGGHSLLSDLLGATLDRYLAVATFPVLSPTMDELAARVIDRMTFNASGVSATIGPGDRLTVGVAKAAKVPVTGLCTANAETYAGQRISYLDLAAGASVALSLTGCNAGGSGGTSGTGGAQGAGGGGGGGSSGTGGRAGTGGTAGAGGTPGSGGMAGTGGAGGRAGASGNGGAIGSGGAGGGSVDAGAAVDVRMAADATTGDAGTTDASRKPASGSGCSCTVRDGAPSPGALLVSLLVLTVLPVRRRRQGRN